jgi:hypothetical protein
MPGLTPGPARSWKHYDRNDEGFGTDAALHGEPTRRKEPERMTATNVLALSLALAATLLHAPSAAGTRQAPSDLEFIDTSIENGSPLWYELVDNVIRINLIYDHERS